MQKNISPSDFKEILTYKDNTIERMAIIIDGLKVIVKSQHSTIEKLTVQLNEHTFLLDKSLETLQASFNCNTSLHRPKIAQKAIEDFIFFEGINVETYNGFTYTNQSDDYNCSVFISHVDQPNSPSEKISFTVFFEKESIVVKDVTALDSKGNPCGVFHPF